LMLKDLVVWKEDNTVWCGTVRVTHPVTGCGDSGDIAVAWPVTACFGTGQTWRSHRKRLIRGADGFAQTPLVSKYVFLLQQEVDFFKVRFIQSARKWPPLSLKCHPRLININCRKTARNAASCINSNLL
jgi:hypothetical protein